MDQTDYKKMVHVLSIHRLCSNLDDMADHGLFLSSSQEQQIRSLQALIPPYGGTDEEFSAADDHYHDRIDQLINAFPGWVSRLDHTDRSISALRQNTLGEYNTLVVGTHSQLDRVHKVASQWAPLPREGSRPGFLHVVSVDATGLSFGAGNQVGRDFFIRVAQALGFDPDTNCKYDLLSYLHILDQIRDRLQNEMGEDLPSESDYQTWGGSWNKYVIMVTGLDRGLGGWIFCNARDELWNTPGCRWVTYASLEDSRWLLRHPPDFFDRQIDLSTGINGGAHYQR